MYTFDDAAKSFQTRTRSFSPKTLPRESMICNSLVTEAGTSNFNHVRIIILNRSYILKNHERNAHFILQKAVFSNRAMIKLRRKCTDAYLNIIHPTARFARVSIITWVLQPQRMDDTMKQKNFIRKPTKLRHQQHQKVAMFELI